MESREEVIRRRQIIFTLVIGIVFMLIGEPYMAACSAGFTAGAIALILPLIYSITAGTSFYMLPDVFLVLICGYIYSRFMKRTEKMIFRVLCPSITFFLFRGISALKAVLLELPFVEEALQGQYIRQTVYAFLLSLAFFILFMALKAYVMEPKILDDGQER